MGMNINQLLVRELENLDKDPDSCRAAMKALKSYVKDLDPKFIPVFLARASEIKDLGSASGECLISLLEVLVRSHGCNIVPNINNIMDIIMKTLSSSSGSSALHQSCSKVVPAIARYGIDPLMLEDEKARIICSLCKPLSDVLMCSQENAASGAALCLRALVLSDNWRFALDDMVNEVCLKVAGALEELQTQTTSHMGLVMALLQHNSFIVDAYAMSLIRSGLQILSADIKEKNSQKWLLAIQMINFIMKCVDSRSIASEIAKIVDVMEESQNDHMPFVRGAAFEALQTAKIIASQKGSWHEVFSSPFVGSNSGRRIDRILPQMGKGNSGDTWDSGSPVEFPSHLPASVSFAQDDPAVGSPLSLGQSSCNVQCGGCATRRMWDSGTSIFDAPIENGFYCQAVSSSDSSIVHVEGSRNAKLSDIHRECSEALSGSFHPSARKVKSSTSSPRRSRSQLVDNVNIYSSPQKLSRSLQNSSNAKFGDRERQLSRIIASPTSVEDEWNPRLVLNTASSNQNLKHAVKTRVNGRMSRVNSQQRIWDAEHVASRTEFSSSTGVCSADYTCTAKCRGRPNDKDRVQMVEEQMSRYGKAVLSSLFCLFMVFIAVILSMWVGNDEVFSNVVPT